MITAIDCRETVIPVREKFQNMRDLLQTVSLVCWFLLSLVLFMVLGPFAAPVALFAVFGIDNEHRGLCEPEAAE